MTNSSVHWTGTEMVSDAPELYAAIESDDLDTIQALIASGINPNQVNWDEAVTALELAATTGNVGIVKALLDAGVHPDFGMTCLPLAQAVTDGNVAIVQLLVDAGANVDLSLEDEETYAEIAASKGFLEILEILNQSSTRSDSLSDE